MDGNFMLLNTGREIVPSGLAFCDRVYQIARRTRFTLSKARLP